MILIKQVLLLLVYVLDRSVFFFQAEDGIRDHCVTGVQTCALPIWEHNVYAILIWHEHKTPVVYRDVIVQVADDPEFKSDVHTLFNNDQDNSSGLGVGTDREYFENHEGKLIDRSEEHTSELQSHSDLVCR